MSPYDEKGFKWLAGLLRMGMLKGSFIPEKENRIKIYMEIQMKIRMKIRMKNQHLLILALMS